MRHSMILLRSDLITENVISSVIIFHQRLRPLSAALKQIHSLREGKSTLSMHVRNIEGRRAIGTPHVPKLSFPFFLQTLPPPLPPHLSSHAYITWLGRSDQYCLCEAFYPNGWIIWKRNESHALNEHGTVNHFWASLSAFGAWIKK